MLTIGIIILIVALAVFTFFKTAPQIGGKVSGERLTRARSAQNYENGVFVNSILTKMDMPFKTLMGVFKHYLFEDKKVKSPQQEIVTNPFSKKDFEEKEGTLLVWFGHSTILMKVNGYTILTDPVLVGKRASMFSFMGPKRFNYKNHIEVAELPKIDFVLMSHDHYDHLDYPTIKALSKSVDKFYMPLGVGAHFESWGVPAQNIVEFEWWDEIELENLKLAFTPTRHFSGRALRDRFKTLWGSWVIKGEQNIFFSGDSGYFPGFKEIGEKYGPFDLTFMECGAYNEAWSEIHMFPEESAQAHLDVRGNLMMPIHWGKFDLSLHPWKESVNRLIKKAGEENIQLVTPQIGEIVSYSDTIETTKWWESY